MADLASNVSAIDRVQTHRPRQIETSHPRNPAGVRILVRQLDGVGPVQIVLHGFFTGLGIHCQSSAPVALQVPVSASNLSCVRAKRQSHGGAAPGCRAAAADSAIVEGDSGTNPPLLSE